MPRRASTSCWTNSNELAMFCWMKVIAFSVTSLAPCGRSRPVPQQADEGGLPWTLSWCHGKLVPWTVGFAKITCYSQTGASPTSVGDDKLIRKCRGDPTDKAFV